MKMDNYKILMIFLLLFGFTAVEAQNGKKAQADRYSAERLEENKRLSEEARMLISNRNEREMLYQLQAVAKKGDEKIVYRRGAKGPAFVTDQVLFIDGKRVELISNDVYNRLHPGKRKFIDEHPEKFIVGNGNIEEVVRKAKNHAK